MTMAWLERLEEILPERIGRAVEDGEKAVDGFRLHKRLSHWRPISTAPCNQELELRILLDGQISTLEFPCLHSNADAWINVDLGSEIKIEPIEWRIWQHDKSPEPHHCKIKPSDRSALFRFDPPRRVQRSSGEDRYPRPAHGHARRPGERSQSLF